MPDLRLPLLFLGTLLATYALTWLARTYALRRGLIDRPGPRSSHSVPTPRGGGLSMVITIHGGSVILWAWGILHSQFLLALCGGGLLVAIVGFWDDHRPLPVRWRLLGHTVAAIWSLSWLGGMPPLALGIATIHWGWLGHVIGVISIVWLVNLYNFMDGIDGIAAGEALTVAAGAALLLLQWRLPGLSTASFLTAAAAAGFLPWNWPPARVFMGDVGSGFLGFCLALLAISSGRSMPLLILAWAVLLAVFEVDATCTLMERLSRRAVFYQAHRCHAYQHAASRFGHARTTVAVLILNALWLLPAAIGLLYWPRLALALALTATAPLALGARRLRAGRLNRVLADT